MGHNHITKRTMVTAALVAILAVSAVSVATAPSTAEAAKRGSYVYSKMKATSSSIADIFPENWVYFAWESSKPLRINVADQATGQVTLAKAANVTVTKSSDSKVIIHATITESGIAGLNVGDAVTYTADPIAYTATFVDETTGQSSSGQLIYANISIASR